MARRTSIGIIGMGWVGSSVAISLLHSGSVNEVLVHDVREGLAEGEAMDLAHGSSFYPSALVRSGTVEEMYDADAIVIAAGKAERRVRLDELKTEATVVWPLSESISLADVLEACLSDFLPRYTVENSNYALEFWIDDHYYEFSLESDASHTSVELHGLSI